MPTSLTASTFDTFLNSVASCTHGTDLIDLSEVRFVSPAGMVLLTVLLEQMHRDGIGKPCLVVPDENVRSYLSRAGFFSCFDGTIDVRPVLGRLSRLRHEVRRGSNPLLLELTKLEAMKQIPSLLDDLWWTLKYKMKYKKNEAYDLCIVTSEICQNSFEHNLDGVFGLFAVQVYRESRERFLELAIGDCGQGIKASLANNRDHAQIVSDVDSIITAIEPGVSEHEDQTRGNGLNLLMELVFKHQGSVTIRSGSGKVHVRMDQKKGWPFRVPPLVGAQVVVSLPTKEVPGA